MPLDVEAVRRALPRTTVHWFLRVASTMDEAARLAAAGGDGIVVAEEQTAGRGRFGRIWHSEPEAGLYATFILRLPLPPEDAPVLALALALATGEAIARVADLACDLRWPNDVLIAGRKCAGILVEAGPGAFLAGIGINVNHAQLPEELAGQATSLRLASGRACSREHLLVELARTVQAFTRMLVEGGPQPVLEMFRRASSFAEGRRVRVETPKGPVEGVTDGLDPSGFLWLRTDLGERLLVRSGGVRPLE
ncbi:MAG: biotin--[acetyl-CoA-carboxylase] ligase [Bryobacterales bacterium]|nr:biotin--[acetyl-CoA-carboxylase] ligase [Bryobacteraceae bacterium]MDW8129039.1 biotin--[acetyl-CoA-carboxylase] ligase [Bryobacterales bacterium]